MRRIYLLLLLAASLCSVNMAYAQSTPAMLDPVELRQTVAEVGNEKFVLYDVTQGKYVAQGGTAGVRCVLAPSGSLFQLSGTYNILTSYNTSASSYLGSGTGDDLYVNLTTAATWTFTAADQADGSKYLMKCGDKYLQADANGNLKFVSSGGDTFVLISRAKLKERIKGNNEGKLIDVTALIDNSRFERKDGEANTEDKSGWTFSDPGQGEGWRWAKDNMDYPVKDKYYHLIGVFDAEKEKVTLYRDGVKVGEADAKGKYMFPKALEFQWFVIGGEPGQFKDYNYAVGGRQGMPGHNVITRLYSKALTQEDVTSLHNELKSPKTFADVVAGNTLAYNVSYAKNILAKEGSVLPIHGTGFTEADEITLVPNTSVTQAKGMAAAREAIKPVIYDKGIKLTLPALNTGNYSIKLKRGDKVQFLGNINIIETSTIIIPAIAHRVWAGKRKVHGSGCGKYDV
ncbi:MAG: LamG-like jellyroll fold domain-containing protein, partial [Prevotella sp.]